MVFLLRRRVLDWHFRDAFANAHLQWVQGIKRGILNIPVHFSSHFVCALVTLTLTVSRMSDWMVSAMPLTRLTTRAIGLTQGRPTNSSTAITASSITCLKFTTNRGRSTMLLTKLLNISLRHPLQIIFSKASIARWILPTTESLIFSKVFERP